MKETISTISNTYKHGIHQPHPQPSDNNPPPPSYQHAVKVSEPDTHWFRNSFRQFCNNTALHGYNYIVRDDTAQWERIAWTVIVIAALITAIILLWISWAWNAEIPTTTVIESTHYATWNIPFPAITICNFNRISKKAALELASKMKRPKSLTVEQLSEKLKLMLHFKGISKTGDYDELQQIFDENNLDVMKVMTQISPKCTDMLERCMWKGTQERCDSLFQPINTTQGICCSFNYLGLAKSNFPMKLVHSVPKFPRRVTACGYQTGLTVLANPAIEDYHTTFMSSYGFRIFIHNSYDFPDENSEIKTVTAKLEAFISLSPESTYSTPSVYRLPIKDRNCYFTEEIKLKVMQKYTYINCMAECRSELLYKVCGCIPYGYPNYGNIQTCNMNNITCVQAHKEIHSGALPGVNHTMAVLSDSPCQCLPDCELLQYPSEITAGVLDRLYSFNSINFFKDTEIKDQSLIHIFFNDLVSTHYRKDIYQNWLGVLASFGGLLGLLLGFSFVTGFELIYFFTIRPIFDRLMYQQHIHQ